MKTLISNLTRLLCNRDLLLNLFLIVLPLVYFSPITLGQGVWFGDDISKSYYPMGLELSRALARGTLPFWTTGVGAGYPVLAEGQTGPLYPINWFFYKLLPVERAISYGMLLHLILLACGMYWCARAFGVRRPAAALGGLSLSFSSFSLTELLHPNVIQTFAWLPWLILGERLVHQLRYRSLGLLLMIGAIAMQLLAGFPQVTFLSLMLFGLWGLYDHLTQFKSLRQFLVEIFLELGVPLLAGSAIAAAQIVPTVELIGNSVRSSGLDISVVGGYSLLPEYLGELLFPYAVFKPTSHTNGYFAYFGVAPLVLAFLAPFLRRNRQTMFLAIFALVTLSFTLGEHNPVFGLLAKYPPFNLFRVPMRYLSLTLFAAALLTCISFDALLARLSDSKSVRGSVALGFLIGSSALVLIIWGRNQSNEFWLATWRVLPLVFLVLTVGLLVWAWVRRVTSQRFAILVIGLVLFDLVCFAFPFFPTIYNIIEPSIARVAPRSLQAIQISTVDGRVFSDESVMAEYPASRNSLMPNTGLIYNKPSALIYTSLALATFNWYINRVSLPMFNLLNVRYYTMALDSRPQGKPLTPPYFLSMDVFDKETAISPTIASAIDMVSFTEWGNNLDDQATVAEVVIHSTNGKTQTFPIRLGNETADWDYELKESSPGQASVASTFPSFWRPASRTFAGHTYATRFQLDAENEIDRIHVRVLEPDAGFTIQSIKLRDRRGQAVSLAQLTRKNDFSLVYLSDTVAVWKNANTLPRAFIYHIAEIANDAQVIARLHTVDFSPERVILLSDGKPISDQGNTNTQDSVQIVSYEPERVEVTAETDRTGYLFLADTWYPGWNAYVDGHPTSIQRADMLFRAVQIEPGQHHVVFEFRPLSFVIGATISIISVLTLAGISTYYFLVKRQLHDD